MMELGTATYSNPTADETKVDVKAAGTRKNLIVTGFTCFNPDASDPAYVQFFDALAANVTLGTTPPFFVLPLPPLGGLDGPCGPRRFFTNICYAVTATPTGSGAPTSDCIVQIDYL